ncbi:hypothetical protein PtrARCrB10_10137 [Pyrenophora tritici-repentis]|nr:hypothetical protein PtrARCrB10_10137 [Pyrenophora tritici-repentis]
MYKLHSHNVVFYNQSMAVPGLATPLLPEATRSIMIPCRTDIPQHSIITVNRDVNKQVKLA